MSETKSLWQRPARDVVALLTSHQITIEDTLDCLEQRISKVDQTINALPTLCFDRARERAGHLQKLPVSERGLLCGLPVAIKDLTPVSGVVTSFGCKLFEGAVSEQSDQLVTTIEANGGVVYAKSNTPEFGTGGITFNDVFGLTRSPRNTYCASGGSSGGAAAALASGMSWLSHGSDMAGSLRTPAAFCGVVSLRPSPGRIRSDSITTPHAVLGQEGPMARDIDDLALFTETMLHQPTRTSMQTAVGNCQSHIKIAVSPDLGIATIDDDVLEEFWRFVEVLKSEQHHVTESSPKLDGVHEAFDVLRAHEYAIGLDMLQQENPGVMKPEVEWNIDFGRQLTAERIRQQTRVQGQLVHDAAQFMRDYDVLLCPATSVTSVPAELRYPGSDQGVRYEDYYRWLAIAYATTMTALPVITLPCGTAENGMPVAVQIIGKPWQEGALLAAAKTIEKCSQWDTTPVDPVKIT